MANDRPERVGPMALAKELKVRPQVLYALIRQKRLRAYENEQGKTVVFRSEAVAVLNSVRPRRTTEQVTTRGASGTPLKRDQVASYSTYGNRGPDGRASVYRKIVAVTDVDEHFTILQDLRGQLVPFQHQSLRKLMEKGQFTIEEPWELLKMVAKQWISEGKTDLATDLARFIQSHGAFEAPETAVAEGWR